MIIWAKYRNQLSQRIDSCSKEEVENRLAHYREIYNYGWKIWAETK